MKGPGKSHCRFSLHIVTSKVLERLPDMNHLLNISRRCQLIEVENAQFNIIMEVNLVNQLSSIEPTFNSS